MATFLSKILAPQFRKPGGLLGGMVSNIMLKRNQEPYEWVLSACGVGPDDRVLEIGFGPGYGISRALDAVSSGTGTVTGVDFSSAMVKKAKAAIRRLPAREKVRLEQCNADCLPFEDASFDLVFAVNVLYFWPDLDRCFKELCRVLAPGGRALMYFTDAASLKAMPVAHAGVFHFYEADQISAALLAAGFAACEHSKKEISTGGASRTGHIVIATK